MINISDSDEDDSEDEFEETPIRKSVDKKNNRMLDDHSVHEIDNSSDNSSDGEEEGSEDDDEEYAESESSGEDFESPEVVKTKTPKRKVAPKVEESSEEELVDVFPSPVNTHKSDKKTSETFKFDKKSSENIEQVLSGPFSVGQKFTQAEVGALETKLTSIRRSIEKVTTTSTNVRISFC